MSYGIRHRGRTVHPLLLVIIRHKDAMLVNEGLPVRRRHSCPWMLPESRRKLHSANPQIDESLPAGRGQLPSRNAMAKPTTVLTLSSDVRVPKLRLDLGVGERETGNLIGSDKGRTGRLWRRQSAHWFYRTADDRQDQRQSRTSLSTQWRLFREGAS
jgi:hypothetical protein